MNGVSTVKRLWFWFLVPIVIILEITFQWWIPRQDPTDRDWKAAVRAVRELSQDGDLVIIAPAWAVQGRMYFKDFMSFEDFGRFDTTRYRRIFEVSISGARSPETEGLTPDSTLRFGTLSVARYPLPPPAKIRYDFTEAWQSAAYDNTPKQEPKLVIDHWFNPRRVLPFNLKRKSSITFNDVPLGGVLRGYAVIGYREGRFNEGDPIRLRIFLDNKRIGEARIANFSPIEPFTYRLPGSGTGTVKFEVLATNNKHREFGIAADVRKGEK